MVRVTNWSFSLAAFAGLVCAVGVDAIAQSRPGATRAAATQQSKADPFVSADAILRWMNGYRAKPEPQKLSLAFRAMVVHGVLQDNETSGVYLGFMAGVLGVAGKHAPELIEKLFPIPPEHQLNIIKAIAYSDLPDWTDVLRSFAERMPARAVAIDRYLTGKMPALADLALDSGPAPLDIMWGQYYASGAYDPILRIVSVLPWSKEQNNLERLTIGAMAKWTLASNSSRDMDLLRLLKGAIAHETKANAAILSDVIEAAETGEIGKIRKDAVASIEVLKTKGPQSGRQMAWWGQAGQTTLALGCIVASALGQAQVGIPCVIGGALSGAALKMAAPQ